LSTFLTGSHCKFRPNTEGKIARNLGGSLPDDFIMWLEVLLGGESDLLMCDPASPYQYGADFAKKMSAAGLSDADVLKVKIWNSGYPKEPQKGSCGIPLHRSAIQNDDADQQNPGSSSRDMQGTGCVLIKDCSSAAEHRQFEVELFTSPPGAASNAVRCAFSAEIYTRGCHWILRMFA
jgi:alpha-amylase